MKPEALPTRVEIEGPLHEVAEHFRHIVIAPMFMQPKVTVRYVPQINSISIRVVLPVFDRESFLPTSVAIERMHDVRDLNARVNAPTEYAEHLVRSLLVEAFEHEIDECLRGPDGKHLHDPHSDQMRAEDVG